MTVQIVDANILIDFNVGQLVKQLLQLPNKLVVPDVIARELKDPPWDLLMQLGFNEMSLTGQQVREVAHLRQKYKRPGTNDLFALVLAKHLDTVLLTGDKHLRDAALNEGIVTHGTLWLLDQMVFLTIISPVQGAEALSLMLDAGTRLPLKECAKRISCGKEWQKMISHGPC